MISEISDWFTLPDGTLIRVFGGQKLPHLLSRYAIEKNFMQEVYCHIAIRLSTTLHNTKKVPWNFIPFHIGFNLNLDINTKTYKYNYKYTNVVEITLHFINIEEVKNA